jgi:hypothetical protein
MTKPVPVEPPFFALASIETTDGITRFAISATEPGARSTELEVLDKFIDCPNSDPDEEAPKMAPTSPATKARSIALARVIKFALPFLFAGIHHGP